MDRLRLATPLLSTVLSTLFLLGCEEKPAPTASTGRSDGVVMAAGTSSKAPSAASAAPEKVAKSTARKGGLCSPTNVRPLPSERISGAGTSSMPFSGGSLPKGSLTWVNLWAAWCEPCKKELPLLKKWQSNLKKQGVSLELVFISIDDDKRQLTHFLEKNTAGLTTTYWLEEGAMRDAWLKKTDLPQDPRLPVHLLLNRSGEVFCQVDGAIEETDFEEVVKNLKSAG